MKQLTASMLCALALMLFVSCAWAEYDADAAAGWLEQFAAEIAQMQPIGDAAATADPARAGEYLLEYPFGTVVAGTENAPAAGEILRVELTGDGVTDCRGLSVGQTLEDVIAGREIPASETPLYVLSTQDTGYGFSWAYVGESGVYGVEYITYGGDELAMKEYTLTYVIEDHVITAIRLKVADATLAVAQDGLRTAEEIASRQMGEILVRENTMAAFDAADMTVSYRRVIGAPVEDLIALIGEPQEIQALPGGGGRMLVYAFCAAELAFNEQTGVETVRALTCVVQDIAGPRGICVGMDAKAAAALFRCDNPVHSTGGALYLGGEAQGMPPYGEVIPGDDGHYSLRYACELPEGMVGMLYIGTQDGKVLSWQLSIEEMEAAYGG